MITFEQRERWARARAERSLDPTVDGFATGDLFAYLDGPGVAVTVFAADVLAQPVDFADDLPGVVLPNQFEGITANGVSFLSEVTTTSTALIRYAPSYGGGGWRGLVALDRCGGVTAAIGATSRYELDKGRHAGVGVLRLFILVHLVRVVVDAQARLLEWASGQTPPVSVAAPFEIVVAVPDTAGMMLGGLNEGWEDPEYGHELPRVREGNVMVRLQVEEWPTDADDREELMLRVVDRACEAFGDRQQRYRRASGRPGAGTISRSYA